MFIKAIVVPILIVCLVLFWGISANNIGTIDQNGNTSTSIYDNNLRTDMTGDSFNNGLNGDKTNRSDLTNMNNLSLLDNNMTGLNRDTNVTDNGASTNYAMQNTVSDRIRNEIERINGVANATVVLDGNMAYVAINLNDNSFVGTNTIKEQAKKSITANTTNINKACIVCDQNLYAKTRNNNSIDMFRNYMNDGNLVTIGR